MSDWITMALSALLVIITGIYAFLTYRLARSSDRSAAASERAAASAADAAEQSRAGLEVQRAALAVQRANQPMGFVLGDAGPFESGFGFVLRTDGGSYLVREVRLLNITFKPLDHDHAGYTFGTDQQLTPSRGTLPAQLDPPDHLLFEVENADSLAQHAFGQGRWMVAWWNVVVTCSFSEDDPATRRVVVWSDRDMGESHERAIRGAPPA